MKPAWEATQRALTFLTALPRLARDGQLDGADLPADFDYEALSALAARLGHSVEPEAIAEAFRIRMLARSAILSRRPPALAVVEPASEGSQSL